MTEKENTLTFALFIKKINHFSNFLMARSEKNCPNQILGQIRIDVLPMLNMRICSFPSSSAAEISR